MGQLHLSALLLLSIERELTDQDDFNCVIDVFVSLRQRGMPCCIVHTCMHGPNQHDFSLEFLGPLWRWGTKMPAPPPLPPLKQNEMGR